MGFVKAVLLAASLGSSVVFAAGHRHTHASVSTPAEISTPAAVATTPTVSHAKTVAPLTAHIESTQVSLKTPNHLESTPTDHLESTETRHATDTKLHTPTLKLFFPIIETKQTKLDVPSTAPAKSLAKKPSTPKSQPQKTPDNDPPAKSPADPSPQKTPSDPPSEKSPDPPSSPEKTPDSPSDKTPDSSPDKTPDSSPDKTPDSSPDSPSEKSSPEPQEHIVLSGGVTLGVSSPPVSGDKPGDHYGPASGTTPDDSPDALHTLWVKGTPLYVGQGLPPAVVQGTTYAVGPTGGWLVNGKPVHTPEATPGPHSHGALSHGAPHHGAPASKGPKGPKWSGTAHHDHPKPTMKPPHSHAPLPGKKPPSAAKGSLTWKGPGLTTETGLSSAEDSGAAAQFGTSLLGVGLGSICLLVALM